LTLDVRDPLDNATTANLSVSVTDLTQAVPVPEETNILTQYALPSVSYPDSLDRTKRLAIQHGFDLKGNFVTSKGKAAAGILTLVQKNVNSEFSITSKEDGTFFVPDLILFDTAQVSFVARTTKGKYGKANLDSTEVRPVIYKVRPLHLNVYKTGTMVRRSIPQSLLKPILLEEVTIRDSRIDTKRSSPLSADFEVSGDWLRERNSTDVLQSLRTKVPGLRIMVVFENGIPRKYLQLSGGSSFGGLADEPLVIIDGQAVNGFFGGPAEQISSLNPNDIDRIEVLKYGNGAAYGARGGNGVIVIYTRRGEDSEKALDLASYDKSKLIPLRIRGYTTARKFITPDYSSSELNKDLLDNRTTVYWNPVVNITRKEPVTLTFYAADLPTQYRVVVEGIAGDGQVVHSEKTLTIRNAP
ncbi:MAG TPA: TonB-dependent receptor plug domain-containing protein, partial [Chryseolinea sp.]|nr:TonB-dependent receptor plug domain-containing protein [Chryseolinea sp.]